MKNHLRIGLLLMCFTQTVLGSEECFNYVNQVVTLKGRVTLRTFFGPPNYGENPKTDSRETQAVLLLDEPICTLANPRDYDDPENNQKEITLVPAIGMNLSSYLGEHVSAQGTLFHAITAHHHTPILMSVQTLTKQGK